MSFNVKLQEMSERVSKLHKSTTNEESTKTALIMPFIASVLGYDVFNPTEFIPEYIADVGMKKGEKVDYAIVVDNDLQMIIECKTSTEPLNDKHKNQLHRYFGVTKTRLGVLTNGIEYRFYSDVENKNIMDEKPFLEFDITDLNEDIAEDIERLTKNNFDLDDVINNAGELKYINQINTKLNTIFNEPTDDFIKFIMNDIYNGLKTQKAIEQFAPITKKATDKFITNKISERLNVALGTSNIVVEEEVVEEQSRIVTTDEELEGYYIVKSLIRRVFNVDRITYRDAISYFAILLDDNNRKPICRLHFNTSNKYVEIVDKDRNSVKHSISSIDDIFNLEELLVENVKQYL